MCKLVKSCHKLVKGCRISCGFRQPCVTLYNLVQLCTTLCNFVQLCTTLYNFVQLCATLYNFANFFPTWPKITSKSEYFCAQDFRTLQTSIAGRIFHLSFGPHSVPLSFQISLPPYRCRMRGRAASLAVAVKAVLEQLVEELGYKPWKIKRDYAAVRT